jgi:hypothetical protein
LSGTPVVKNDMEWAFLGNLLKPGTFPNYIGIGMDDPDRNPMEEFNDYKMNDKQLQGIVTFFPGDTTM